MPDTGAPWNIPYVDPTDLVRDYPAASEDLADAIALGLSAAGSEGIGPNVVSVTKTDPFSMSSQTFAAVTGLTVTITPSSDTSKILILGNIQLNLRRAAEDRGAFRLMRGATPISVGGADGSRFQATGSIHAVGSVRFAYMAGFTVLDSPGVDTPVTYSVEINRVNDTIAVNTELDDPNAATVGRFASTLTAIEVAV
jgi:hypothetical protein